MSGTRLNPWTLRAAVISVVLCGAADAWAVELGGKLGVVVVSQQTDLAVVSDSRVSSRVGLFARWAASPPLHVTGEIAYVQRGPKNARVRSDEPNPDLGTDHVLHYVTVPVVADLQTRAGSWNLFGGTGPRVDLLVDGDSGLYYENFERFVLGAVLAGGVRSAEHGISLELQYNWDLTNSYAADDDHYIRSRSVDVLLGFVF